MKFRRSWSSRHSEPSVPRHFPPMQYVILSLLRAFRFPHHDIQLNVLLRPLEMNLPPDFEPHLAINDRIDLIRALEIARPSLSIRHIRHVRDEFSSIPFASCGFLSADVHEVPGLVVAVSHDAGLGMVQQGQELVEEALLTFGGELVLQAPHSRPEDGEEVVHVVAGRHPVISSTNLCFSIRCERIPKGNAAIAIADGGHETFQAMRIRDVLHHADMEVPLLLLSPMDAVRSIDEVTRGMIIDESFSQTLGSLLVLRQ